MNDDLREQLSALVDDELRRDEAGFLCRRVGRDEAAVDQLGHYFLISDALRRQLPETLDCRLAERVAAALRDEPGIPAARHELARRLVRPLAGLGVAASVAMVAVTFWSPQAQSPLSAQSVQPPVIAAAASPTVVAQPVVLRQQSNAAWERLDPAVQQRLNAYLVNHSEHSATGQFGGVLNYVRIAGQQERD